jgi:flagellar assembly protein FliH
VSPGRLLEDVAFSPFRAPAGGRSGSGAADEFAEEQRRLEQAEKEAFERGLERARQQARTEVDQEAGARLARLEESLAELASLRGRVLEELREEIFALVVDAASRLLRERLESSDPVVARVIDEALAERRAEARWRIRLHPEDLEQLQRAGRDDDDLELVADPSVARGGLVAESGGESIDARVETAMAALRGAIEDPR